MGHRHQLTKAEWARIAPLLPAPATAGTRYKDPRLVRNGMLVRHATGCPWRDLPERYGPWPTVYSRVRRWTREGVWDRVVQAIQRDLAAAGRLDCSLGCIDGSSVRAHRVAGYARSAGARGTRGRPPAPRRAGGPRAGAQPRRVSHEAAPRH